jgi:hypothetical protein
MKVGQIKYESLLNYKFKDLESLTYENIGAQIKLKSCSVNIVGEKVGTNHFKSWEMQSHSGHIVAVQGPLMYKKSPPDQLKHRCLVNIEGE